MENASAVSGCIIIAPCWDDVPRVESTEMPLAGRVKTVLQHILMKIF